MVKGNYLIAHHMWWCNLVVGKGTRETEVVGSNPSNARKNRTRAYSRKKSHDLRHAHIREKENIFLFLFPLQIFILARKRMMPITYVLT